MIDVQIETDLDLSSVAREYGKLLPEKLMREIGQAYRRYRHSVIMSKRQLHDLSAMPPLKPETIERKKNIRKGKVGHGGGRAKAQKLTGKWRRRYGYVWEGDEDVGTAERRRVFLGMKAVAGKRGIVSLYPDTPLVDTGNMTAENSLNIEATPGLLILTQGKTRAKAAEGHQLGTGHLPRRVHLSWNQEFLNTEIIPRLVQYYERVIREKMGRRRVG